MRYVYRIEYDRLVSNEPAFSFGSDEGYDRHIADYIFFLLMDWLYLKCIDEYKDRQHCSKTVIDYEKRHRKGFVESASKVVAEVIDMYNNRHVVKKIYYTFMHNGERIYMIYDEDADISNFVFVNVDRGRITVHYVFKDFSRRPKVIFWCLANDRKALSEIARRIIRDEYVDEAVEYVSKRLQVVVDMDSLAMSLLVFPELRFNELVKFFYEKSFEPSVFIPFDHILNLLKEFDVPLERIVRILDNHAVEKVQRDGKTYYLIMHSMRDEATGNLRCELRVVEFDGEKFSSPFYDQLYTSDGGRNYIVQAFRSFRIEKFIEFVKCLGAAPHHQSFGTTYDVVAKHIFDAIANGVSVYENNGYKVVFYDDEKSGTVMAVIVDENGNVGICEAYYLLYHSLGDAIRYYSKTSAEALAELVQSDVINRFPEDVANILLEKVAELVYSS